MNIKMYQCYAELKDSNPKIWRRFTIDSIATFANLAYVLLTMFETQGEHLFGFVIKNKDQIIKIQDEPDDEFETNQNIKYFELKKKVKYFVDKGINNFIFEYDYGDGWQIEIKLEDSDACKQQLIEGEGYGILENCGGIDRLNKINKPEFDLQDAKLRFKAIPILFEKIYETQEDLTEFEIYMMDKLYKK